ARGRPTPRESNHASEKRLPVWAQHASMNSYRYPMHHGPTSENDIGASPFGLAPNRRSDRSIGSSNSLGSFRLVRSLRHEPHLDTPIAGRGPTQRLGGTSGTGRDAGG